MGTLIGLSVMLPLAGLLGLWLFDQWRARQKRFVPTAAVLVTCDICLHRFFCDKDERLVRCPRCGSLVRQAGDGV